MKIILLGPPGSGKGTVSERLEKDFHLFHLSPGVMLREEVKKETSLGKEIKKYIDHGDLVPDQFVVEMVKLEIKNKKEVILDGFPRTLGQAQAINNLDIDLVIYLDVPEKVVVERLSQRRVCEQGIHSYHLKYLPPKKKGFCDQDGTKLIQRKDDATQAVRERFRVYYQQTQPLIDYYAKKGLLREIDGDQEPEKVYGEVKKTIKSQTS